MQTKDPAEQTHSLSKTEMDCVLQHVFNLLDTKTLATIERVCKDWNKIAEKKITEQILIIIKQSLDLINSANYEEAGKLLASIPPNNSELTLLKITAIEKCQDLIFEDKYKEASKLLASIPVNHNDIESLQQLWSQEKFLLRIHSDEERAYTVVRDIIINHLEKLNAFKAIEEIIINRRYHQISRLTPSKHLSPKILYKCALLRGKFLNEASERFLAAFSAVRLDEKEFKIAKANFTKHKRILTELITILETLENFPAKKMQRLHTFIDTAQVVQNELKKIVNAAADVEISVPKPRKKCTIS